jgi:hypothetical protein
MSNGPTRADVRALIGDEAESLAYLFCLADHRAVLADGRPVILAVHLLRQ